MLVMRPSLPVLQYLWSFSRYKQSLLTFWQFRSGKPATHPLSMSTRRYGAVPWSLCTGCWDIWILPRPPEYASMAHDAQTCIYGSHAVGQEVMYTR